MDKLFEKCKKLVLDNINSDITEEALTTFNYCNSSPIFNRWKNHFRKNAKYSKKPRYKNKT